MLLSLRRDFRKLFARTSLLSVSQRRRRSFQRGLAAESLEAKRLLSAAASDGSAAGRGQDLLLVVNSLDENSLRIANLYQQLRHVPDRNIVFIEPPFEQGFPDQSLEPDEFVNLIVTPISNAISDRGLAGQIDFIDALGLPARFRIDNPSNFGFTSHQSLSYGLSQVTQLAAGLDPALAHFVRTAISRSAPDSVIRHEDTFDVVYNDGQSRATQYFAAGLIAYTGPFGNSVEQVLEGLTRSATADGTAPNGTIYFEENDDVRSNTREPQWSGTQAELMSRGIPFVEESDTPGWTPQARNDVRGAVVGLRKPSFRTNRRTCRVRGRTI